MKQLSMILAVCVIAIPAVAMADDLISPPWERGTQGSTYQEWTFSQPNQGVPWMPDEGYINPNGDPMAFPAGAETGSILSDYNGRQGVWESSPAPMSGMLQINIPNTPEPDAYKDIYIQVISHGNGNLVDPVLGGGLMGDITLTDTTNVGPGDWWYSRWHIHIEPSPSSESIQLRSCHPMAQLRIDQIVIDTICVPEPASLALLGMGMMAVLRRRR